MVRSVRRGLVVCWVPLSIGCNLGIAPPIDTALPIPPVDTGVNNVEGHCAASGEVPVFDVQSTVNGTIDVTNTGPILPNCGVYDVFIEQKDYFYLVIDYGRIEDTAEECPDTCMWTFTYQIGVAEGDWTLQLRSTLEERTVTVR